MRCPAARLCLFALPLIAAALPAHAADQPATTPARDVDITYRVAGPPGAASAEQRVRWDIGRGLERIDPPTPGLHIIVDAGHHRIASVRDAEKLAMEIDQSGVRPAGGDAAAHYTRRGSDTVAGLACGVWQADGSGAAPLLCFTDDGVLLRVAAAGQTVAEAVRVRYAPSQAADFDIPDGYRRVVREPADPGQPSGTAP